MPRTFAGGALALVALMAFNAWRQGYRVAGPDGGLYTLKSWLSSIFLNKPLPKLKGV